ncbi:MAG: TIR domain-containing protein [Pseudomonadota bacterium]
MATIIISYTTADLAWAQRVDRVLTDAGHTTVAMFKFKGRWTSRMAEAVAGADKFALIASLASRKSPGVKLEIEEFLAKDLGAEDIEIFQVQPTEPFPLLRSYVPTPLYDVPDAELADCIRAAFDDAPAMAVQDAMPAPPVAPDVTPNWPQVTSRGMKLSRTVQGRDDDVRALFDLLRQDDRTAIVPGVAVKGAGGMGKTTLARYFVQQYRHLYHGIWWMRAQSVDTIIEDLGELAGHIDVPADKHPTPKALAGAVVTALEKQADPWLLIYDNAESAQDLADWVPEGPQILITSREGVWQGYETLPAERLAPQAAADLLMQEAERSEDREGAEQLAEALGHLPLALVNAGAWLRDTPGTAFAAYETRIEELIQEKPETVTDYPDSVFAAVSLSLDKLSDDAKLLMNVFAHLAPDDLWPGLVTALGGDEGVVTSAEHMEPIPDALWSLAKDPARVEQTFAELSRRSLLEQGEHDGSWRIHRLTQAVQRAQQGDEENWGVIAAAMLAAGYPGGRQNPQHNKHWPVCSRLGTHVAALADRSDPPPCAALEYLLHQASIYLDTQRLDERALEYDSKSLTFREARLGPMHPSVGSSCASIAVSHYRLQRYEEAEALAARAIEIDRAAGVDGARAAVHLSVHGSVARALGARLKGEERSAKLALAARRYREALAIDLRLNDRDHRAVAIRLNNLAGLRAFQGRWGAALRLHGRALAFKCASLSLGDPQTATSLANLGGTLLQSGSARAGYRGQGVLDLLTEALSIFECAFADRADHPSTVGTVDRLASAHWCLAQLGPPITGNIAPDPARAEALCADYKLDRKKLQARAADFALRARLHDSGQPVSPMPGEGEE